MTQSEYIISKFGGVNALARALNRQPSTVQGWKARGWIPGPRWQEILAAAKTQGVHLNPRDFCAHVEIEDSAA